MAWRCLCLPPAPLPVPPFLFFRIHTRVENAVYVSDDVLAPPLGTFLHRSTQCAVAEAPMLRRRRSLTHSDSESMQRRCERASWERAFQPVAQPVGSLAPKFRCLYYSCGVRTVLQYRYVRTYGTDRNGTGTLHTTATLNVLTYIVRLTQYVSTGREGRGIRDVFLLARHHRPVSVSTPRELTTRFRLIRVKPSGEQLEKGSKTAPKLQRCIGTLHILAPLQTIRFSLLCGVQAQ